MSKQLLLKAIAGLTGIATLSLSSFSFAGGDYAPASAPTPAPVAAEGGKGFYLGVRGGYADVHYGDSKPCGAALFGSEGKPKHKGFAGGFEMGYAFNPFIGLSASFLHLPDVKLPAARTVLGQPTLLSGVPVQAVVINGQAITLQNAVNTRSVFNQDYRIKNHAFDIAAKATLPIPAVENFGLYGKVGVGFLNSKLTNSSGTYSVNAKGHTAKLTYGAGAYWDVTSNIRVDAGWQRFQGQSKTVTKVNKLGCQSNVDVFTVGVSYFLGGNDELFNS